jgi:hypothetical protein
LELDDEHRQLISKGQLKKKGTGSESADLHVFLLDRYLLIAKQKYMQKQEKYKLYRPVGRFGRLQKCNMIEANTCP